MDVREFWKLQKNAIDRALGESQGSYVVWPEIPPEGLTIHCRNLQTGEEWDAVVIAPMT